MKHSLEFEPTKHIKLDLFPALVYSVGEAPEDAELIASESRLIVTDTYIYVILQDGVGNPYFVVKEELVEIIAKDNNVYQVSGANLDYHAERDGNCGCGMKLRGMRLLPGVRHISRRAIKKG